MADLQVCCYSIRESRS